jgi:hypothetical protein
MALVMWEFLRKSQFDNEKIEEAIARLIAAHNADESSHLEVGQSLQSHKASSIIDHLAASVVEDKLGDKQVTVSKLYDDKLVLRPTFESLDAWGQSAAGSGAAIFVSVGNCRLTCGSGSGDQTKVYIEFPIGGVTKEKNPFFQCILDFSSDPTRQNVAVVVGAFNPWSTTECFGFRWNASQSKMYCHVYAQGETTQYEVPDFDPDTAHTLRAEMSEGGDVIQYFVDGVIVQTFTDVGSELDTELVFCFANQNASIGDNSEAVIRNVIFTEDW